MFSRYTSVLVSLLKTAKEQRGARFTAGADSCQICATPASSAPLTSVGTPPDAGMRRRLVPTASVK